MELLGAAATHVGNVRENNQDRVHFGGYVAVVADGMGGHQGGETAATIAVSEFLQITAPVGTSGLVELVEDANRAVFERAADPDLRGMGTTLVALTLRPTESKVAIVNVGDSRAYFLRGSELGRVTYDHSLVEDLVRQKRLTPEEALHHPQRNILTRALGISSHVEVDQFLLQVKVGDRFLLCSDGLFNEVSEDDILRLLQEYRAPAEAADALVAAALSGAGRDNITVAVIDVVEDGQGGSVTPSFAADAELGSVPGPDTDVTPPEGIRGLDPSGHSLVAENGTATGGPAAPGSAAGSPLPNGPIATTGSAPARRGPRGGVLLDESAPLAPGRAATVHPAPSHRGAPDVGPDAVNRGAGNSAFTPQPETVLGAEAPMIEPVGLEPEPPRRRVVLGLVVLGMVLGALVAGGYLAARWYNQKTWYVEAAANGQVSIYQGRPGGFLWNEPTLKIEGDLKLDELTAEDKDKVANEPTFPSREAAEDFVSNLMAKALEPAADALGVVSTSSTTANPLDGIATTVPASPNPSVPDAASPNVAQPNATDPATTNPVVPESGSSTIVGN